MTQVWLLWANEDSDVFAVYSTLERAKEAATNIAAENPYLKKYTEHWGTPPPTAEWVSHGDRFRLWFEHDLYYTVEPYEVDAQ